MSVLRQIIDDPLTPANNFLLDKLSSASFNLNPPKILKPTSTWDVNILLDHFVQMGPNEKFKSVNRLGGKLMLQLLLTQMRRSGEIAQLQLSTMRLLQGAVEFELTTPTKTFNPRNQGHTSKLQRITVCKFEGDSLLCPLTTLLAYLEMTHHRRGWVDHLFVLVTTQTPQRATRTSIVRWSKDIMTEAGLDKFPIHSTRSASSTSAFLMGLPLDCIVSRVGWMRASTFIKHYMKPLTSKTPSKKFKSKEVGCLPDPHGYAGIIHDASP